MLQTVLGENPMKTRSLPATALIFAMGVLIGGYLFAKSQPRAFLALKDCNGACLHAEQVTGLVASVGVLRFPRLIPYIVKETDHCAAMRAPYASQDQSHFHYVIFPKKDIKDIADIAIEDQPYIWDCIGLMRALIVEQGLRNYRVTTNGPGFQDVGYLHFHIVSE